MTFTGLHEGSAGLSVYSRALPFMFYAYLTVDNQGRIYIGGKSEAGRDGVRKIATRPSFPLEERDLRLDAREMEEMDTI